jgi:uncharacterized protein
LLKPFRDLALGLAPRGIAALRYEKRTQQYAGKLDGLANFTVKEESIDDALAARSSRESARPTRRSQD